MDRVFVSYNLPDEGLGAIAAKENVVLAPHLGSATLEVGTNMSLMVAENVIAFLEGKGPPNRVA